MSRLGARECFAQHGLDGRPAGQSLDGPGEGQHVAPEAIGQKQFGGRASIVRLQRRFEAFQPALRIRRGCRLFSFSDVHHGARSLPTPMVLSGGNAGLSAVMPATNLSTVMPGFMPGIHVFKTQQQ